MGSVRERQNLRISGEVQGVFFRETVRRIAAGYDVHGFVRNLGDDIVEVEAEGDAREVHAFFEDILANPPSAARIEHVHATPKQPIGTSGFFVTASKRDGP